MYICIRNQTNTLRFCREDNPLYVLLYGIGHVCDIIVGNVYIILAYISIY